MGISKELRQELEKRFTTINEFSTKKESLIRETKDFSFAAIKEKITWFFDRIKIIQSHVEYISNEWPEEHIRNLIAIFDKLIEIFTAIDAYDPVKIDTPGPQKDQLIAQVETAYNQYYQKLLHDFVPAEKRVSTAEDSIKKILKEVTDKQIEIDNISKKSKDTYKAIQDVAATSPIERYHNIFNDEADNNKVAAKKWMIALIICTLLALGLASWLFGDFQNKISDGLDSTVAIQLLVAKLVLVTIVFYLLNRFSKNYNAHKHLEAVNRHRQNSLRVFKSFIESTDDEKIKKLLLIQASEAIFKQVETGYISQKSDSKSTDIKLIEQFFPNKDT